MATTSDTGTTRPASGHVDWEFAKATGRRLVPAGPAGERRARRPTSSPSCARRPSGPRQPVAETARLHAPAGAQPGARRRPRAAGSTPTSTRCAPCSTRSSTQARPAQGRRAQRRPGAAIGGKVTGGEAGALWRSSPARSSASTTSPRAARPGCCSSRPTSSHVERELEVDPHDFRLWVAHARGDPPGAVHRGAVAARPHDRPRARALAVDLAPDPERARPADARSSWPRNLPEALRSGGGGPGRAVRHAGAAGQDRPRSPPSCRCSRATPTSSWTTSGPQVIPSVGADPGASSTQRRKGAGGVDRLLRRLLGLEAKMRQYRDGAVLRPRGHRRRSASTASTRSGPRPRRCRCRPRSSTRRPGCAGSTAERPRDDAGRP